MWMSILRASTRLASCCALVAFCSCAALKADELSFRDQILLIHLSETLPAAGTTAVSSMAGASVELASLGSFILVRGGGGGMYVLDPNRAFSRWGETGVSFGGGPLDALRFRFNAYRESSLSYLWTTYGRGRFTEEELASMSISPGTALTWKRFRLPDAERYESAMSARAEPAEQQLMGRLIIEAVRNFVANNFSPETYVPDLGPVPILTYAPDVTVTVPLRNRKAGHADRIVLYVPINPTLPPYVGYPDLARGR
jgi:hypothetical protein